MVEAWHKQFNPQRFLSRVNIDHFIEHNEAHNESRVDSLARPCILCNGTQGPGLLLNDKSYLCRSCFADVSGVKYPEKDEELRRKYFTQREARGQARDAFVESCGYRKISTFLVAVCWIPLALLYLNIAYIVLPIALFVIYQFAQKKHKRKLSGWDSAYPHPVEPKLRHFHDPCAELTRRDRIILKIFNNRF